MHISHISYKSAQGVVVSEFETSEPIDRTPETPGSDKKEIALEFEKMFTLVFKKNHSNLKEKIYSSQS